MDRGTVAVWLVACQFRAAPGSTRIAGAGHPGQPPAQDSDKSTNLKLTSVATDVTGVSGRAILAELIQGQATPEQMANLAKSRLCVKRVEPKNPGRACQAQSSLRLDGVVVPDRQIG